MTSVIGETLQDPRHQALLDEFGFVVVPFLGDVLDDLQALHDRLGAAPDDPQVALHFGFHSKSLEHKRAVSDALRPLVAADCAATFVGHDVYLAMIITKWPGADSGFGPHQDPTILDEQRFRGVSIWTPLCDTGWIDGRDNGMLHVVPGSHRFAGGARVRDIDQSVFNAHEEAIVQRHGVGVPTRRGEAIVFDNRLIHYSLPNDTDRPRVVVSLGMRPHDAVCLLPRSTADGRVALHEVADDSWIEVVASAVDQWEPPPGRVTVVDPPSVRFTPDEFDRLCRSVATPPGVVPGHRPEVVDTDGVNPSVFCAFCGTTEGLEDVVRSGRSKAQLVCPTCQLDVAPPGGDHRSTGRRRTVATKVRAALRRQLHM